MTGEIRVVPTEKYKNNVSDWESHLKSVTDDVESKFRNEIGDYDWPSLYASVETDTSISLDSSCRGDVDGNCGSDNSLSCVESAVDSKSWSDSTDGIVVVDDYDYDGFAGCAQLASADDSDPGIALLGKNGDNKRVMFHEVLHLYNGQHKHHRVHSWQYSCTVMGPYDTGCDGNDPPDNPNMEVNQHDGCTADTVEAYMDNADI